jgi:hypothetical protein
MRFDRIEHHRQLMHVRAGVDHLGGHDDVIAVSSTAVCAL